jgi:hypothetical protein
MVRHRLVRTIKLDGIYYITVYRRKRKKGLVANVTKRKQRKVRRRRR